MLTTDQKWAEVDRIIRTINARRRSDSPVICKTNTERYIDNNFNLETREDR
jgi:hypothetical protein